jgi:hypothetical protein
MEPGQMPQYIVNMLELLERKIHDVQNYHGASAGTAVSGVRSDVHAQNLQEQDLLPLTTLDELMRVGFERMGEKILTIAAEKLTEERKIAFTGEDNRLSMRSFQGEMLGSTRKVKVRMKNAHLRNKGATINNILQMYQIGGIKDSFGMPDHAKLMRLLEFALPESAFDDMRRQSELAYEFIDRILRDEPVYVLPWQDPKVHLSVYDDYMNGTEFMDLLDAAQSGDQQALATVQQLFQHRQQYVDMYLKSVAGLAPPQNTQQEGRPQQGADQQKQGKERQGSTPTEKPKTSR